MAASGGRPIVVPEEAIVDAVDVAAATGIDVSATGSAAIAALLVADGRPAADETVAVIFSGCAPRLTAGRGEAAGGHVA